MIGQQLRAAYVDEPMTAYFIRKFPELSEQDLRIRIEETIKFLYISGACAGAIPVTREIDDVWHYWILQTQEYMWLCESLPSGEYIHHSSNDYLAFFDPLVGQDDDLTNGVRMLALYVANFGPFVADGVKYWRLATHLMSDFGWSLDEVNDWLAIPIAAVA